jgi:hypothetical protein
MLLHNDEVAIRKIFRGSTPVELEIGSRIESFESIEYVDTGVGFYSTVRVDPPLRAVPEIKMWELNFTNSKFPHGGSLMCSILDASTLKLEGVAFGGAAWPSLSLDDELCEI